LSVFGVWKNGHITVNGVDLSDHAREITLETSVVELPDNVHGDNTNKVRAGLEEWTVTATFLQDFAAGKVDATLRGGSIGTVGHSAFNVIVGADAASVSTTNPRYSGNAILSSYRPFGGSHGSNLEATATFRCAGNLTRQTS
jgi:hypothetical protein